MKIQLEELCQEDSGRPPAAYLEFLREKLQEEGVTGRSSERTGLCQKVELAYRAAREQLGEMQAFYAQHQALNDSRYRKENISLGDDPTDYIFKFSHEMHERGALYSVLELRQVRENLKAAYQQSKEQSGNDREKIQRLLAAYRSALASSQHHLENSAAVGAAYQRGLSGSQLHLRNAKIIEGHTLGDVLSDDSLKAAPRLRLAKAWIFSHASGIYSGDGPALVEEIVQGLGTFSPQKLNSKERSLYQSLQEEVQEMKKRIVNPRTLLDKCYQDVSNLLAAVRIVPTPAPVPAAVGVPLVAVEEPITAGSARGEIVREQSPPGELPDGGKEESAPYSSGLSRVEYDPRRIAMLSGDFVVRPPTHYQKDLPETSPPLPKPHVPAPISAPVALPVTPTSIEAAPPEVREFEDFDEGKPTQRLRDYKPGFFRRVGLAIGGVVLAAGLGLAAYFHHSENAADAVRTPAAAAEIIIAPAPPPTRGKPVTAPVPAPTLEAVSDAESTEPVRHSHTMLTAHQQQVYDLVQEGFRRPDGSRVRPADQYARSSFGTPRDKVITNQEILNQMYRMKLSTEAEVWDFTSSCLGLSLQDLIDQGRDSISTPETLASIVAQERPAHCSVKGFWKAQ